MNSEKTGSHLDNPVANLILKRKITKFGSAKHIVLPKSFPGESVYVLQLGSAIKPTVYAETEKTINGKTHVLVEVPMGRKFYIPKKLAKDWIIT